MQWSDYQETIFDHVKNRRGHCIVEAVAGSGKSTTIVEAIRRAPDLKVLLLTFGRDIFEDLRKKVKALHNPNHTVSTLHSFCLQSLKKVIPGLKYEKQAGLGNNAKLRKLAADLQIEWQLPYAVRLNAMTLVSHAKKAGLGTAVLASDTETWAELADRFHCNNEHELFFDFAQALLKKDIEATYQLKIIDYNGMIYHCVLDKPELEHFDLVAVDEAQDMSPMDHAVIRRLITGNTQLMAVGDPAQSIYAFRGADAHSFGKLHYEFNCKELPLTVSYRCSRAVVAKAQSIVSRIEPSPYAPEGIVEEGIRPDFSQMKAGQDVILCRNNAPLFTLAFRLLAKGRGVQIVGSDFSTGLIELIHKFVWAEKPIPCTNLQHELALYIKDETWRLRERSEEEAADTLVDKGECLKVIISSLPVTADSRDAENKIRDLFHVGRQKLLQLSTVHRAKGKEWEHVWLLRPELIPPSWLLDRAARERKEYEDGEISEITSQALEQEEHLSYVAITRAKYGYYELNWDEKEEIGNVLEDITGGVRLFKESKPPKERTAAAYSQAQHISWLEKKSEHVSFVIDCGEFGKCDICHEPAGMIIPNGKRFCGGGCYQQYQKQLQRAIAPDSPERIS